MEKTLIGKKLGMSQIFDEKGRVTPVTVIQAGPCVVLEKKTVEKHGYSAVQLGFGERKAKNVSKAVKGHCKQAGLEDNLPQKIKEFRLNADCEMAPGAKIDASAFSAGDFVDISGTMKGRGFQGVVKRYNFRGGRYSHGGGWKRKPGSIGQCEFPARVYKGKKMPGQMGNVKRTIQNLLVVKVSVEDDIICVKGAVPGPKGGFVSINAAKKK
ncbi:MAG: 50S ribosomal protein L3 [Kiritimatiellaeota bacterium]|nr:50S ribosomal protein L3 [Kiritimatiellota bacterium]